MMNSFLQLALLGFVRLGFGRLDQKSMTPEVVFKQFSQDLDYLSFLVLFVVAIQIVGEVSECKDFFTLKLGILNILFFLIKQALDIFIRVPAKKLR